MLHWRLCNLPEFIPKIAITSQKQSPMSKKKSENIPQNSAFGFIAAFLLSLQKKTDVFRGSYLANRAMCREDLDYYTVSWLTL